MPYANCLFQSDYSDMYLHFVGTTKTPVALSILHRSLETNFFVQAFDICMKFLQ